MARIRCEADRKRSEKRAAHRRRHRAEKSRFWSKVHRRGALENPHERITAGEIMDAAEEE